VVRTYHYLQSPCASLFRSLQGHLILHTGDRILGPLGDDTDVIVHEVRGNLGVGNRTAIGVVVGVEERLADEPQLAGILYRPGDRSEEHTSELQSRENLVCL